MTSNQPIVEFSHITMQFPGVLANDDVSLSVMPSQTAIALRVMVSVTEIAPVYSVLSFVGSVPSVV